jgi:hypothetical protein
MLYRLRRKAVQREATWVAHPFALSCEEMEEEQSPSTTIQILSEIPQLLTDAELTDHGFIALGIVSL